MKKGKKNYYILLVHCKIQWTFTIQWYSFLKKDQMVEIGKINKVYSGLSIMLVHLTYLWLNLTGKDVLDRRRYNYGTKI